MAGRSFILRRPLPLQHKDNKETCDHEWKEFKQTVIPDNINFDMRYRCYFKLYACPKCREKRYYDYIKERRSKQHDR